MQAFLISTWKTTKVLAALQMVLLLWCTRSGAYSVLTHEELIDLAWNDSIRPLLLAKFPGATDHQLVVAHSYAYGGSAVQDMGYYPFGKRFFSNLTHYVRSGDFVAWMLQNARTLDEYAFAIGALSHYLGDSVGHSEAINPATAIAFPKLERKYGNSVTYGESPHGHIRTEFAFDVQELSNLELAPPAYLRAVGFRVPRKFLERAFAHTYGFDIHSILGPDQPELRSYRTTVRSFVPAFAEAEVVLHRHKFPSPPEDDAYQVFSKRVARTNFERRWKHTYKGPGVKAHLLAVVVFIVPKVGGAADLAIKIPTSETQHWYFHSVNQTVDALNDTLRRLREEAGDPISLANLDLDTGRQEKPGDYPLADETYADLLKQITAKSESTISKTLKQHILEYYAGASQEQEPVLERLALIEKMKSKEDR
jgi:Zinc dependent phospholipase C